MEILWWVQDVKSIQKNKFYLKKIVARRLRHSAAVLPSSQGRRKETAADVIQNPAGGHTLSTQGRRKARRKARRKGRRKERRKGLAADTPLVARLRRKAPSQGRRKASSQGRRKASQGSLHKGDLGPEHDLFK